MDLSKILASSCRQRILKTLSKNQAVAMMKLVQAVNSTYNEVERNLRILETENFITQEHHGHKRVIRLNLKNKKTLVLIKTLRTLDSRIDHDQPDDDLEFIAEFSSRKQQNAAASN